MRKDLYNRVNLKYQIVMQRLIFALGFV